jgi:uroporphyrinogen decarboxylase
VGVSDRFLRACRRQPVDVTPIWIMRQAGRYLPQYRAVREKVGFLELCKSPDLVTEVTLQPVEYLGVDAAIIFSDILIPAEAMGMKLEIGDAGPVLHNPVRSAADVERLRVPNPDDETGFVMEAIRRTRRALSGRVPLIGFCGAPFTLASYLIEGRGGEGFLTTKRLFFEQPEAAHALLGKIASTLAAYVAAQVRAGAEAIQIFDSWGGELAPGDFERYSAPYLSRIIAAVRKEGAPVILFATSAGGLLERMSNLEPDVIGADWRIGLDDVRPRVGRDIAVQGNLDPCALFLPEAELRSRVSDILARVGPEPGHVFNLGHGILPQTDPGKAKRLVELVHELGKK